MHTATHGPGAAEARAQSLLDHAATHAAQTADLTAPHWAWLDTAGGPVLERVYPKQGLRVRQSDVTIFAVARQ